MIIIIITLQYNDVKQCVRCANSRRDMLLRNRSAYRGRTHVEGLRIQGGRGEGIKITLNISVCDQNGKERFRNVEA